MTTFHKKVEDAMAEARAIGNLLSLAQIAIDHMSLSGEEQEELAKGFRKEFFEEKLKETKSELAHLGV